MSPIVPGNTLGILGGGQLGRMLAMAAAQLGLKTHIYAPEADSPAFDVSAERTIASYEDEEALARFARSVDVVTYEFENVPSAAAAILASHAPLAPNARALATTQDRLEEKSFIAGLGIPTAPFAAVASEAELTEAVSRIGRPAVLKTRRFGYDGKGQAMIRPDTDLASAFSSVGGKTSILEGFVPFERELSVVAARTAAGAFAAYDLCANTHRDHILDITQVPGRRVGRDRETRRRDRPRHRRGAGLRGRPRRRAVSADKAKAWWSTRSRRVFIIPGTGPWAARGHRNSSSMCAPSAAGRSARRPASAGWRCRTSSATRSGGGSAFWPNPARSSIFTEKPRLGRAARWGTSPGFFRKAPEPFSKRSVSPSDRRFCCEEVWTIRPSSGSHAGQREVRETRLIYFLPQSIRRKTRKSRAGSCPG